MILLVTCSKRGAECATILETALAEQVQLSDSVRRAAALARSNEYSTLVLDDPMVESEPEALESLKPATVFATLLETSTGMGHDIEAIGRVVAPSKVLLVVDGISGVGAMECRTDAWGIDVAMSGSQKGLMTPPGLGFVRIGRVRWRSAYRGTARRRGYLF